MPSLLDDLPDEEKDDFVLAPVAITEDPETVSIKTNQQRDELAAAQAEVRKLLEAEAAAAREKQEETVEGAPRRDDATPTLLGGANPA